MIGILLKIRWIQLSRALEGLGLFRAIFILVIFGFALFFLFMLSSTSTTSYYVLGIGVLLVSAIHLQRKDKLFLMIHLDQPQQILRSEYLLLIFPLMIFLLIHFQWIPAIILLFTSMIIAQSHLQWKQPVFHTKLQKAIPSASFEWKAGFRKYFIFIVPIWIVGLLTSFYIASVPLVLFILGLIPLGFYEKGEPYQMIILYEMSPQRFLRHKIKWQTAIFTILSLPLILIFLFFHPSLWYIPIIEYFVFSSLHIYYILTKYAFYQPNNSSPAAQIFNSIGAISSIVAILLPLVWVMSIRFYFKSIANLKPYLNDFH